jgi:hypothetical protein
MCGGAAWKERRTFAIAAATGLAVAFLSSNMPNGAPNGRSFGHSPAARSQVCQVNRTSVRPPTSGPIATVLQTRPGTKSATAHRTPALWFVLEGQQPDSRLYQRDHQTLFASVHLSVQVWPLQALFCETEHTLAHLSTSSIFALIPLAPVLRNSDSFQNLRHAVLQLLP